MKYYPEEYMNERMADPKDSGLRYAGIVRRMISKYLGDLYNPETFSWVEELVLRKFVKEWVEQKVIHKVPYDCNYIDNAFKKTLYDYGFTHVEFDHSTIEKGYEGIDYHEWPNFGI
ncbi:MAG: hypothetical protein JST86_00945 [Bacteroidetes bacterium]|nr:hypothetical protein [Bacteroidota bacterium]